MSMGKGGTNATTPKIFTGVQVQTSASGVTIAIVGGQRKISINLLWAGKFTKTKINNGKGKGGGKGLGGGKGKGGATYDYKVAGMMGLAEGPGHSIGRVWANGQETTLSALGLTFYPGEPDDDVWPFLLENYPDQALAYAYTAKLVAEAYDLGASATMPNHEFEYAGFLFGSMPDTVDINPADWIEFLSNSPQLGFGPVNLDADSLDNYRTYCRAQGIFFSPLLDESNTALTDVFKNYADITNTWIFWSGDAVKFVPLGDAEITGNGVTFTPDLSPAFELTIKDFRYDEGDTPVEVDITDPSTIANHVKLECLDRDNAYATAVVEWQDQAMADRFGDVDTPVSSAHDICDLNVANIVKILVGQKQAWVQKKHSFKLGYEHSRLEPGDPGTIYEPSSGIKSPRMVRIVSMDEDENDDWEVVAEDVILGAGSVSQTSETQNDGFVLDTQVDPGNCLFPIIFEPSADLTNGVPELWLSLSGGEDWGGAFVYISFDNIDFGNCLGAITAPAWQGTLRSTFAAHADPDTTHTLAIDLTNSVSVMETTATHGDADNFRTLALLVANTPLLPNVIPNTGEMIAYGGAAQGAGPYDFDLTYVRRGLYGTSVQSFATGSRFARFDLASADNPISNTVLRYAFPTQYIGVPIYLKFVSYNKFGEAPQDISTLDSFSYTPNGAGFGSDARVNGRRTVTIDGTIITSPYTLKNNDATVYIKNTSGAAVEVRMPPLPSNGQSIKVKDKLGNADTYYISVKDNSGAILLDKIMGPKGTSAEQTWSSPDAAWDTTS